MKEAKVNAIVAAKLYEEEDAKKGNDITQLQLKLQERDAKVLKMEEQLTEERSQVAKLSKEREKLKYKLEAVSG